MESGLKTNQYPSFCVQKHHSKVCFPRQFELMDLAKRYMIFPLKVVVQNGAKRILLAMVRPQDQQAIFDVEERTGLPVTPVLCDELDIHWLVQRFYYGRATTPSPACRPMELNHSWLDELLGLPSEPSGLGNIQIR